MSANGDADAEIVRSDNFGEASVLCVVEAEAVEFRRCLEAKCAEVLQTLHNLVRHFLQLVVFERVVFLLFKTQQNQ